jgi:DNA-binding MarR family transcriptional regulator
MYSADEIDRKARKPSKAKWPAKGRFAVLNAFVDYSLAALDHPSRSVWFLLYRDTRPDGLARTAQADIARRIGMSTRTVKRAVHNLESLGLLTVKYRGGLGGRVSVYRVNPIPHKGT